MSLAESGLKVTTGRTKSECLDRLKKVIDEKGKDFFIKLVKEQTDFIINQMGANPRYKLA